MNFSLIIYLSPQFNVKSKTIGILIMLQILKKIKILYNNISEIHPSFFEEKLKSSKFAKSLVRNKLLYF